MARSSLSVLVVSVLLSLLGCSLVGAQSVPLATAQALSAVNDVTVLNYALTLENLEATYYAQGLAIFNSSTFFQGVSASVPNGTVVYSYLQMIALHEATHVQFLTTAINAAIPNAAVPACKYNFAAAYTSPLAFLTTAAALENAGQTAYDGALDGITTPAYALVAAEIATVEARHAAFLNLLTGTVPFPQAFDNATLPAAIAAAITPFLVSCPYNITLPQVRPTGVTLGATNTTSVGTGSLNGTYGYTTAQKLNDLVALNYALTLENFEAAFYNYTLTKFTAAQFATAGMPTYYYPYIQIIAAHESLHAATLSMVIASRGGTPVPLCTYNFSSVTTVAAVLATSAVLENTGVMAYDGAANSITDTVLQTVAAQIATVEARHASFLNYANGAVPFPASFDNATSPALIIAAVVATGFIACPYTPVGPVLISAFAAAPATVSGDPAFVGFHAQSFQVHGIPSRHFNLISTPSAQVSATFTMIEEGEAWTASRMKQARLISAMKSSANSAPLPLTTAFSHQGTFLTTVACKLGGAVVVVQAGKYTQGMASITLNGQALEVSPNAVKVAENHYITHSSPHTLQVDTPQVSFTLVNSDNFFNIEQATLNQQWTDDMQMEGLLGQTANPAWTPLNTREFKQHMIYDYLIGSEDITSDDFVSNLYKAPSKAQ